MGRIPDSFLDELLARADIVELIEARVPLKRTGREYQARCPFHDERSPSFTVSPQKQFYHCFGCGAHGTAIKFLMEYDRMEFLDAVEELAQRVGMQVPRDARAVAVGEYTDLYEVLDAAARYYQRQLDASDTAKAYLAARGVDDANRKRFAIGYAPDSWDGVKSALGTHAARVKALEVAGLLTTGDRGNSYDKFRDRVMFPIRDRRGRVIAFGGRVITPEATPKYLNSPETPVFHKGRELFGLYEVRQAHPKIPRLIVVEGYMDVIALFQYGVTQAVATLGTATTREHAELLFRNSADVYFCFDGDKAGRSAAWRAVESVLPRLKDGRQGHFLFLPEGEDPDTLIRHEGIEGFEQRLKQAMPLSEFFFAHQEEGTNLASADGRARLAEKCKGMIAGIPEGSFRDRMVEMLTEKTVSWSSIRGAAQSLQEGAKALLEDRLTVARGGTPEWTRTSLPAGIPKTMGTANAKPRRSVVRSAIALLLQQPGLVQLIEPPYLFGALRQPGVELLMELIALCRLRPDITTGALLERFEGREESAALHKLALLEFPADAEQCRAEFVDALEQLNRQTLQQRTDELSARQADGTLTEAEKAELRECLAAKSRR